MRRQFYREPLLHFLILGAAIFGLNALRGPSVDPDSNRIVVTVGQVERMANLWMQSWKRAPSDVELQALVRDYVKEEIYYREALKLGLDTEDTVIRRRLRQKMEFLATAVTDFAEPDESTLEAYLRDNASRYEIGPRYDFEQVYFRENNPVVLEAARADLRGGQAKPGGLGDAISLPASMSGANAVDVSRVFGTVFYDALAGIDSGDWQGPVESGFGVHLVRVASVTPARMPTLGEARQAVENDWRAEQSEAAEKAAFEQILAGYEIEIELPD